MDTRAHYSHTSQRRRLRLTATYSQRSTRTSLAVRTGPLLAEEQVEDSAREVVAKTSCLPIATPFSFKYPGAFVPYGGCRPNQLADGRATIRRLYRHATSLILSRGATHPSSGLSRSTRKKLVPPLNDSGDVQTSGAACQTGALSIRSFERSAVGRVPAIE
jgi:hypothetical protein